ncbi:MAG: OsmC family peroxiredoxin [Candidatus Eisenbacteria bacterium]|uniref:OsmC family peroxiredoxin n=1 Tax=Eiseniibacteriota bacterium TaxID=2212470 RepID=A0A538S9X0_UNCEI|nr:MAG: OsmC family peroxiredoxin [Candidatus Eisenbacteria bacterium]TMQ59520.1 MAG: OsmC family peroxiredoxin [Candidatus Eisenbacteria bacterium]
MSASASDEHHFDCRLVWTGAAKGPTSTYEGYSREYRVDFEGKPSLKGSAAPVFRGDPALHDPEDLLVAALTGCHCLSYLALCARGGVQVLAYEDAAKGKMERVEGVVRFTEVMLHPKVTIAPGSDAEKAKSLHERAHAICFIANSVNFPVKHAPTISVAAPV